MGKEKSKKRRKSSSESSSSSSSDSSREKKKLRKLKKKLKKEQKKTEKALKKKIKEDKKKLKKKHRSKSTSQSRDDNAAAEENASADIPLELMEKSKAMAPMTKEEWEKRQSVVRKVLDEESGRYRLSYHSNILYNLSFLLIKLFVSETTDNSKITYLHKFKHLLLTHYHPSVVYCFQVNKR
ncbi:uncharacterized protein LOC142976465 isoform X1 [Anticarsia gemmatalis]|uniref:uncharacterized protein LOC142976465 isoform X1 n=1 Tax=Anticarsia gemmatalis TaxID=129554 RepID=UPI003F757ECA